MISSHLTFIGFVFIIFFAPNAGVLVVGTFFVLVIPVPVLAMLLLLTNLVDSSALPGGVFAAATPNYAAEICPKRSEVTSPHTSTSAGSLVI